MTRRVAGLVAGLLGAAVALTGCSSDTPTTGDKGYVDGKGVVTRLPGDERKQLTSDVAGETLEGERVSLEDMRGKVVVLNVWGSWCPPCRKEAPVLVEAAQELAGDEVEFLGINTRDSSTSQGAAFQRTYDVPYPSVYDPDGRNLLAFAGTLPPSAIPSTIVVDQEGRVAASIIGEVTRPSTLVGLVEDVRDGAERDGAGS